MATLTTFCYYGLLNLLGYTCVLDVGLTSVYCRVAECFKVLVCIGLYLCLVMRFS